MPPQYQVAGRIYKIEKDQDSFKLSLVRDQKIHKIEFGKAPPHSEFLVEGDLIAVISAQEITLLAPQTRSLPARSFDKELLQKWEKYQQLVRDFFHQENFLEIKNAVSCSMSWYRT